MSDVFTIGRLTTSSGVLIAIDCEAENVVWKQGLFRGSSILSGSGELLNESVSNIWIILLDCYGRAYLQYPPARLSGSFWSMANIRLGREIARIEFWGVDKTGHQALQSLADGMLGDRSWPPQMLDNLPTHSVLGSVDLLYKKGFLPIF